MELLWKFAFTLFIIIFVLSSMLFFIRRQATGVLMKTQLVAKETCLLITTARKPSTLEIKGFLVEKKDSGILIKSSKNDPGYFYPCYVNNTEIIAKENSTIIKIK